MKLLSWGKRQAKWIEAIGLLILLLAAAFQFQADSEQTSITSYNIDNTFQEIEFNRQKIMTLIQCVEADKCDDYDRDHIRAEAHAFISVTAEEDQTFWGNLRFVAFIIGSLLLVMAKFLEATKTKNRSEDHASQARVP